MPSLKNTTASFTAPYLGRRAKVTTTYHTSSSTGLRTVETLWIDDAHEKNGGHPAGTTVKRVVRGDGRDSEFETLSTEIIPPVKCIGCDAPLEDGNCATTDCPRYVHPLS